MDLQPPTVVHVQYDPYDMYIGRAMPRQGLRASAWRNPYRIGEDGDRAAVLVKYELLMRENLRRWPADYQDRLRALSGKRLGCWCHPAPCHGDILVKLWWEFVGSATDGD